MKFLIAGLGSIGRRHLRNLVELGEEDVLLYRTHQATLSDVDLSHYPVVTDLEKAIEQKPDAVVISNPTALHLKVAIPCAEAGCALFLEKPLSTDCEGLEDLRQILKRTGKQTLVGFQFRFHPAFPQVAVWLEEGVIGRVVSSSVYWGEYLPDWHPWEDYRVSYSARKDLGGGVVLTLCHPMDYLHWLLGEINMVSAFVGKISDLELEVEDMAEITMHHANGAVSRIHLDYYHQPKKHALEIAGSNGTIAWDEASGEARLYKADEKRWLTFKPPVTFNRNDMFLAEMRHFLAVIQNNEQPVCSFSDGIRIQQIIMAAYQSAENGQIAVSLPNV
jgi:predicted dehydrogenase